MHYDLYRLNPLLTNFNSLKITSVFMVNDLPTENEDNKHIAVALENGRIVIYELYTHSYEFRLQIKFQFKSKNLPQELTDVRKSEQLGRDWFFGIDNTNKSLNLLRFPSELFERLYKYDQVVKEKQDSRLKSSRLKNGKPPDPYSVKIHDRVKDYSLLTLKNAKTLQLAILTWDEEAKSIFANPLSRRPTNRFKIKFLYLKSMLDISTTSNISESDTVTSKNSKPDFEELYADLDLSLYTDIEEIQWLTPTKILFSSANVLYQAELRNQIVTIFDKNFAQFEHKSSCAMLNHEVCDRFLNSDNVVIKVETDLESSSTAESSLRNFDDSINAQDSTKQVPPVLFTKMRNKKNETTICSNFYAFLTKNYLKIHDELDMLQCIDLPLKFTNIVHSSLTSHNFSILLFNQHNLYALKPLSVDSIIEQFVANNQFRRAIRIRPNDPNLLCQNALYLFTETRNFIKSMQLFQQAEACLAQVMCLFPGLMPQAYRRQIQFPLDIPEFTDQELTYAYQAAHDFFLLPIREKFNSNMEEFKNFSFVKKSPEIPDATVEVLLTSLVKIKLEMFEGDNMSPSGNGDLGPLLRRSGENVKLESVEKSLLKKNLIAELVILYGKHGRHDKALHVLQDKLMVQEFLRYIENLVEEHGDFNILASYLVWMLENAKLERVFGILQIFDKLRVLRLLQTTHELKPYHKPYLEHLILNCNDQTPIIHSELIFIYIEDRIDELTLSDPDELNDGNQQLAFMIDFSDIYDKQRILNKLKSDGDWNQYLYKEQALIYGKLGRFQEMFDVLVGSTNDQDVLEMYAVRFYKEEQNFRVFSFLIKALYKIHEGRNGGLTESDQSSLPDSISEVMSRYFHCVDLEHLIEITALPDSISLVELGRFLTADVTLKDVKMHRTSMLDEFSSKLMNETSDFDLKGESKAFNGENQAVRVKRGSTCLVCGVGLGQKGKLAKFKDSVLHLDCVKCLSF